MLVASGRPSPYQVLFIIIEFILISLATVLAVYLRLGDVEEIFTWKYSWHRIFLVPVVMEITFYYLDLHNFRIARPFIWIITRSAQAVGVGVLLLTVIYYLVPRLFLGRGVLFIAFFTIWGAVLLGRTIYHWALKHSLFSARVLMVASGDLADSIIEEMLSRSDNIYDVVCIIDTERGRRQNNPHPPANVNLMEAWARLLKAELRSDASELTGLVRYYEVDLVVVAMDEKRGQMPLDELLRVRMLGIPVMTGEDFFEAIAGRILAGSIKTSWLVFAPGFTTNALRRFTKRTTDIVVSALGLILCSPLALLTALAIRLDSPGPVIFRQRRVGQYGREFTMYKFRSMVVDAESASGPTWAQDKDPRVTRVGRVIRKLRLDEIPQLWNVLVGDMSFVGPRPERAYFVERLSRRIPYYNERHNVKPGITGWAQVCYPYGSSEASALEKLNYDLYYIKHSSLSMDITIMLQTIKIILFGGGGR